jgi:hypothetical protein
MPNLMTEAVRDVMQGGAGGGGVAGRLAVWAL